MVLVGPIYVGGSGDEEPHSDSWIRGGSVSAAQPALFPGVRAPDDYQLGLFRAAQGEAAVPFYERAITTWPALLADRLLERAYAHGRCYFGRSVSPGSRLPRERFLLATWPTTPYGGASTASPLGRRSSCCSPRCRGLYRAAPLDLPGLSRSVYGPRGDYPGGRSV